MAGMNPANAFELNTLAGTALRQFVLNRELIARYQKFMAGADLTTLPDWPIGQAGIDAQVAIKSAVSSLNTALSAIDTTFVDRVTGLF